MERGTYLWVRVSYTYWPAIAITAEDAVLKEPTQGSIYVYWFGDCRISSVTLKNTLPFAPHFVPTFAFLINDMGQKWKAGVLEAIQAYSELDANVTFEDAIKIAYKTYHLSSHKIKIFVPHSVSVELTKRLLEQWRPFNTPKRMAILMEYVKDGRNIRELCLACYSKVTCVDHPIFQGKLCVQCRDKLYHTIFGVKNQRYKFCTICGNNLNMIKCFNKSCKRTYCGQCLKNLQVKMKNSWMCLMCVPDQSIFTKVREDHPLRTLQFLVPLAEIKTFNAVDCTKENMLVLFHGKCKALEILCPSNVAIGVEDRRSLIGFAPLKTLDFLLWKAYFIDLPRGMDSCSATIYYQREVNIKKISKFGNIGVLIGGTSHPAVGIRNFDNDFQAKLFWEFNRVHHLIQTRSKKQKVDLKFVFELNATVPKICIDVISRYTGTAPFLLVVPGKANRLVWTNFDCQ